MNKNAVIYLVPVPIDDHGAGTIPEDTLKSLHKVKYFIAERGKTARKFIKMLNHPSPQNELTVIEIPKHGKIDYNELMQILSEGYDLGIMSESGCPGIADPGSEIVAWAHEKDYKVIPLVGPSSLLLALMASGFSGQSFVFHGYLPADKDELPKRLRTLESNASKLSQSQIFIETPYRNKKMFDAALNVLQPNTKLSIHMGLTGPDAFSKTLTIKQWKLLTGEVLKEDVPAVFIIG